jgi:DNA polymerase-3 subunit gamma/tau
MAYTVLARRYRSSTFDEVVGQEHVAQTLKKAIETGRIAHAYLFCGTRGTGKTSTARILAKALNCDKSDGPTTEPCGKCESCKAIARGDDMDVIEIDAASNTGVDNVREIIENASFRPARSRFKIYIIDEVHMLSKSAFNALLKTLEEPPEHVKFILATTEPEKVLPTILSRCQRYDFRNIPTREIAGHLKSIVKQEKISADDDALLLVAKAGAGSMRDSLSLLDRLLSVGEKKLTIETIEQLLGLPRAQLLFDLAQAIGEGDVKRTLTQADSMIAGGMSADTLITSLVDHLRNLLILRTCGAESGLVDVPGMNPADLNKQAGRFDPVVLTQDITILEELRRTLRQAQTGRALLDATLVRLALAEQFASVGDLMSRVEGDGSPAAAAQKKNGEIARPIIATPVGPAVPAANSGPLIAAGTAGPTEDDDDLPRPGKVWDNSGPSLSELLKQQQPTPSPVAVESAEASVAPLTDADVNSLWPLLLAKMNAEGAMWGSVMSMGRLDSIADGTAIIRFPADAETFARRLSTNGKKDTIANLLTSLRGQPTGVRFEVDAAPAAAVAAAAPPMPASPQPAVASKPRYTAAPPPMPEPSAPAIRLTPELTAALEQDPLVRAVIQELGGRIIKVD